MSKTNPVLRMTIALLDRQGRKQHAPVWRVASQTLASGASRRVEVNVGRISRVAAPDSAVLVPGRVLGTGSLDKKVVVGAYSFSSEARRKIGEAGGLAVSLIDFVDKYPGGRGVTIVQ